MNKERYDKFEEVMDLLKETGYNDVSIIDYSDRLKIEISYFNEKNE